jgi:SAM-dependent methyltransferase
MAEVNPDLCIEGIDLDPRRVELIRSTQERSPRVTVRLGDATELSERPEAWDAVLVCDAFHHFDPDTHKTLARAIADALRPGGVCIVKDLDVEPRWKHEWNRVHDRIVAGPEPVWCRTPAEMAAILAAAGLVPERAGRTERRFTPYAHYLVRARKP